jgi:predicted metal-dependent hydrolase
MAVAANPGDRLFVQFMLRQWGSCNPITGNIRLNTQLAQKPKACLDYVVLHELCHLHVPRNGEAFLPLLNQHMADWQDGTTAPGSPTLP